MADEEAIETTKSTPTHGAKPETPKESFLALGVCKELAEATERLGWQSPTDIQTQAIPLALENKDVIGLAHTGSGKTGAFALPIMQSLLNKPQAFNALAMSPTRELALQIGEQFEALGAGIDLRVAALVGGADHAKQAMSLGKRPHVVVGTPGRVVDHLKNTKGFSLRSLKHLVLDEADRLLDMDFEEDIDQILKVLPRKRTGQLYSATMTKKVEKLQRACLRKPVRVEVSDKFSTVDTLRQEYLFIPAKHKDVYLAYLANETMCNASTLVFTRTCDSTRRLALLLRNLGFTAIPIHGQLPQSARISSLNKFKSGDRKILIATDVASRGLDVPSVSIVLNYDVPANSKDYIHRVGRTARAGKTGRAITMVTQYDVEAYQRVEKDLGHTLPAVPVDEESALFLLERVSEASRLAALQLREEEQKKNKKSKRRNAESEAEEEDASFDRARQHLRGKGKRQRR